MSSGKVKNSRSFETTWSIDEDKPENLLFLLLLLELKVSSLTLMLENCNRIKRGLCLKTLCYILCNSIFNNTCYKFLSVTKKPPPSYKNSASN